MIYEIIVMDMIVLNCDLWDYCDAHDCLNCDLCDLCDGRDVLTCDVCVLSEGL